MRVDNAQTSLRKRAVSSEPSLLVNTTYERGWRSLVRLGSYACEIIGCFSCDKMSYFCKKTSLTVDWSIMSVDRRRHRQAKDRTYLCIVYWSFFLLVPSRRYPSAIDTFVVCWYLFKQFGPRYALIRIQTILTIWVFLKDVFENWQFWGKCQQRQQKLKVCKKWNTKLNCGGGLSYQNWQLKLLPFWASAF